MNNLLDLRGSPKLFRVGDTSGLLRFLIAENPQNRVTLVELRVSVQWVAGEAVEYVITYYDKEFSRTKESLGLKSLS